MSTQLVNLVNLLVSVMVASRMVGWYNHAIEVSPRRYERQAWDH